MDKLKPNPKEEREEVLTDQILQLIIWKRNFVWCNIIVKQGKKKHDKLKTEDNWSRRQ